ncbi:hypothetical protein RUM44_008270 [Polyplax serrata]|uniref:Cytochrome c oxidase subunit n=1 Tax=Polyplax serrata TaxID=468196 RepID=A0ABR1B7X9_POLSC
MALATRALSRKFGTFRVLRASLEQPLDPSVVSHDSSHGGFKIWRTLFFVVCIPAMAIAQINCSLQEEPPRPEFKKYPYLRIRNKKFPWGDGNKTLFHNPHVNALPDGYEDEH